MENKLSSGAVTLQSEFPAGEAEQTVTALQNIHGRHYLCSALHYFAVAALGILRTLPLWIGIGNSSLSHVARVIQYKVVQNNIFAKSGPKLGVRHAPCRSVGIGERPKLINYIPLFSNDTDERSPLYALRHNLACVYATQKSCCAQFVGISSRTHLESRRFEMPEFLSQKMVRWSRRGVKWRECLVLSHWLS